MALVDDAPAAKTALEQAPVIRPGATQFDITSKLSGRDYRVFISTPMVPPPERGYAVVYLSDGNMSFPTAAAVAATYATMRPALIVAVGYPTDSPLELMFRRTRDLTPPTPIENIKPVPGLPPPVPENFSGAEDFHRFLTEELRPLVAAEWKTDPNDQTLYGYSLGGLFTLVSLFNHPTAFNTYVAASPSIWWNNRSVLDGEGPFSRRIAAGEVSPRVLVSIGALEQTPSKVVPPGYTAEQLKEVLADARMVDNARELGARLAALAGKAPYEARFHEFAAEDHLSAQAASIGRAIDFALRP